MSAASNRLTPADFFSRSWRARGSVRTVFGKTLRSVSVEFRGAWSETERAYLLEETATYGDGKVLVRSWHVTADRRGHLVGLEGSQGGRMFVETRRRGFRLLYDRLHFLPGPNVVRLRLSVRARPDGSLTLKGWTRVLGVPVLRTELVCTPA